MYLVLLPLRAIVRAAQALAQVVGKFNHAHGIVTCKIGNIAHCFIFLGRDDFSDGLTV